MDTEEPASYKREILLNQVWQVLNFGSKAGFLVLLTPMMMSKWGKDGYGLFALASSLLVSMALLDGGIRALTRIQMAEAWKAGDDAAARTAYAHGVLTFFCICVAATLVSLAFAASGLLQSIFHLPDGGAMVLVMTVVCTGILMTTILGLEPLAARGNLSTLKAANTWGAIAAIPICAVLVKNGSSVGPVIFAYAMTMTIPNIVVAWRRKLHRLAAWQEVKSFGPTAMMRTLRAGIWYYLTTVSLVAKTHALTFVVSGIGGLGEAGIFYVLLRLSEIVGNVGATSSETSLAALASAPDVRTRRDRFRQSWLHVVLFCTHGALVFAFLTSHFLGFWLPAAGSLPRYVGGALAVFGLVGAFSRVAINTSMGLDLIRPASIAGVREALCSITGAAFGMYWFGLSGLLVGGSTGIVFLIPVSKTISTAVGWRSVVDWFCAIRPLVPGFVAAGMILFAASWSGHMVTWIAALAACATMAFRQLRQLHRTAGT